MRHLLTTLAVALVCVSPSHLAVTRVPVPTFDRLPAATSTYASRPATRPSVEIRLAAAIDDCATSMTDEGRQQLAKAILTESRRHGYDPLFIQAMLEVESRCDPAARGRRGSLGLIQLLPSTARSVAADAGVRWRGDRSLHDSATNVRLALHYLAKLEDRFDDPYLALAAYNLGPSRVASLPPAKARRSVYVKKVMARYAALLADTVAS